MRHYGIAVSMLMAVTTVLAALVALKWGYNPFLVAAVNAKDPSSKASIPKTSPIISGA